MKHFDTDSSTVYGQVIIDTLADKYILSNNFSEMIANHYLEKGVDSDIDAALNSIHRVLCNLDKENTAKLKARLPGLYAAVIEYGKENPGARYEF